MLSCDAVEDGDQGLHRAAIADRVDKRDGPV